MIKTARYDSPGYQDHIPGYPPRNSHDYLTAPGSDGTLVGREDSSAGAVLGTVTVTIPGYSSQAANPAVTVVAGSSQVPGQVPDKEPVTGVGNTWRETFPGTGTPDSHVVTSPHPNSNGVNRD